MAPILGYWDGRGLAEQIRLLLKYLEIGFVDRRYKVGPALTYNSNAWVLEKFSLGLDFPNMPYFIDDGDFKLTHLGAIVEFIAEAHGMVPNCKKQRAVLHMLQCEVMELRMPFAKTFYGTDCVRHRLNQKLPRFEAYLGEKQWLTGEEINYPDFALCDLLMQFTKVEPGYLQEYPKLQAYLSRFELGEQIRLLLKYLKVDFVDKQYKLGPPPAFDKSAWFSDKFTLGLAIPNLPYYIDGDFKLTQSGAIMEYIADVHDMVPKCKKRRAVLHMLQCEVMDLRMSFAKAFFSPDSEKLKPAFFETLAQKLPQFEAFMGEKDWLTGDEINYPDFALCDLLMQVMGYDPTYLKNYHKLEAYLLRFKRAEHICLLLKYLGVEYTCKQYKLGPAPTYDRSVWLSDKFSLGLDFPNLPYFIDKDFKLTQSGAILEYIADEHGMIPDCKKQRAVLHMLQCEVMDLRVSFVDHYINPGCEKLKQSFLQMLLQKLPNFEAYLGDKKWLMGEKVNYPDFNLCELLMRLMEFNQSCLKRYPKLQAYLLRFRNLPALKDYLAGK
ncbi:unnamed protein product [Hydatigera taeniaeformis]|uniref:glutathione transferase n=1 Tax=Hydatigena taeniaeformis TaxID=6205 RepID=A0A158RED9_HYDTA|nr:unnamed protein product [Hydatigera taeniaeformis]